MSQKGGRNEIKLNVKDIIDISDSILLSMLIENDNTTILDWGLNSSYSIYTVFIFIIGIYPLTLDKQ